jgi:hypothetical protein
MPKYSSQVQEEACALPLPLQLLQLQQRRSNADGIALSAFSQQTLSKR